MVAKISFGSSLYGALAYNGEKINKEEGKLLATNKIFDDCSGKTSITNALRDFQRYLSPHIRTEKPVVHISLNPHPDDVLTADGYGDGEHRTGILGAHGIWQPAIHGLQA